MAGERKARLQVPLTHGDEAEHRRIIAERANAGLPKDGSQTATAPIPMQSLVKANLPSASLWEGSIVYVSDEAGGSIICFSDGTNWRRLSDRAVVS